MITQWSEVDLELFYDIFDFYKNHGGSSEDRVIEIQNISGKYFNEVPYTRIFLGAKINPLDYRESNEGICAVFDTFKDKIGGKELEREFSVFNLCFYCVAGGPLITPFGPTEKNIDTFFATSFGDLKDVKRTSVKKSMYNRLILWYTRDKDGKIVYDMSRAPITIPDSQRLIRIRVMDFKDWKNMIDESRRYAKFPDEFEKDDISRESFGEVTE